MKYICLSFDDSRADTFDTALPIMQKYGLRGTVNVITDFVIHPDQYIFTGSSRAMSPQQLLEWQSIGNEIACHGSTHRNTADDVVKNIDELNSMSVNTDHIGFASPSSEITEKNLAATGIHELRKSGIITYIRSGIQVKREGFFYIIFTIAEKYTHSKRLYYYLNRRNVIFKNRQYLVYPSAAVKHYTKKEQIIYLINKMPDESALIIMFHSILKKEDKYYGADNYYWDAERFDMLCRWLYQKNNINVILTGSLHELLQK